MERRMLFSLHIPSPPLDRFIENFWLYRGYASPHLKERIVQDGTFKMVFNLAHDEFRIHDSGRPHTFATYSGAIVSRPSGVPFVTRSAEEAHVLGVNFRIGGALPFLGYLASDTGDSHVDVANLWKHDPIHERLALESEPEAQFRILERALLARLARGRTHHPGTLVALQHLGLAGPASRTREVAREAGLSQRRLIAVFKREIGMTPRLFARVRRFQRVLAMIRCATAPPWPAVALDCGYFDQSHLIRDFVEFSGLSPSEYCSRQRAFTERGLRIKHNHVPLID
jgi:AraC-like DNA-binding protein